MRKHSANTGSPPAKPGEMIWIFGQESQFTYRVSSARRVSASHGFLQLFHERTFDGADLFAMMSRLAVPANAGQGRCQALLMKPMLSKQRNRGSPCQRYTRGTRGDTEHKSS